MASSTKPTKKYEIVLTEPLTIHHGTEILTLHRIRALRDIPDYHVKNGDMGGYILSEFNLSQDIDSNAWIAHDAQVFQFARVSDNAYVGNTAKVFGCATVFNHANIWGNASVSGSSAVKGRATVSDSAHISGKAKVFDHAKIHFGSAP